MLETYQVFHDALGKAVIGYGFAPVLLAVGTASAVSVYRSAGREEDEFHLLFGAKPEQACGGVDDAFGLFQEMIEGTAGNQGGNQMHGDVDSVAVDDVRDQGGVVERAADKLEPAGERLQSREVGRFGFEYHYPPAVVAEESLYQ